MTLKSEIVELISRAAKIPKKKVDGLLEKPPESEMGDFALPCFTLDKKNPAEFAGKIGQRIKPRGVVKEVRVSGPYVNFYADWGKLGQFVLTKILKEGVKYGSGNDKRKIIIEHTSANPDGPLHLGHFRNTVIGDSMARIMRFLGNKVKTISWLNDSGRQIAVAVMEYLKKPSKIKEKPDWWVLDLYVKGNKRVEKKPELEDEIRDVIKRFESGDRELVKTFSFLTNRCIQGHKETLSNIGVKIETFFRDSQSVFDGSVKKMLEKVKKLPQGKSYKGRVWLDLKKFGIKREFTLTREDGTTIYPARDLAFHQYKLSNADFNLNIIGTDQKFYFKQLLSALSLLFPKKAKNYRVVFYEFLLLPEGTMSTRAGKFVSIDEILKKALDLAMKTVQKKMPSYSKALKDNIARAVGVGALKYAMVKVSPEKTYSFSVKDALSFEGDNAPYAQYTHARACSILRKGKVKKIGKFNAGVLQDKREKEVIKSLAEFPDVVKNAARDSRPHYITNYVFALATKFNEFYQKVPVLRAEKDCKQARLALVMAVQVVLKNALGLLGIEAPERM